MSDVPAVETTSPEVTEPAPAPAAEAAPARKKRGPVLTEEQGHIRMGHLSKLLVIGDEALFDANWKNKTEAKGAVWVDIWPDPHAEDPEKAVQDAALAARRIAQSIPKEQLCDGTWRVFVNDGVQAGAIVSGVEASIKRENLLIRVRQWHNDESRVKLLDAVREKGWGTTLLPPNRSEAVLGVRMTDPVRFTVVSDEDGPLELRIRLR